MLTNAVAAYRILLGGQLLRTAWALGWASESLHVPTDQVASWEVVVILRNETRGHTCVRPIATTCPSDLGLLAPHKAKHKAVLCALIKA